MSFKNTSEYQKELEAFGNGVALLIAQHFGPLTSENCGYRIEALTTILIDWHAMNPGVVFDNRAWQHLLVYAPEHLLIQNLEMGAKMDKRLLATAVELTRSERIKLMEEKRGLQVLAVFGYQEAISGNDDIIEGLFKTFNVPKYKLSLQAYVTEDQLSEIKKKD